MTYRFLDPAHCVAALLLLAVGASLMVVAQRRGWRPPLAVAIAVAVALRLGMLALTYRLQPWDFARDFERVGLDTLHHRDPILATKAVRWSYLPVYDFALAGAYWAHVHFHLSWLITGRVPSILSDLGVVVLVGTVAGAVGESAALRRFQYACNPLAILVCAVHGQVDPACLLFSFAAFAVVLRAGPRISGRAAAAAGILLGLGIGAKTWPVLFGPALLLALPSARRRWQFTAATGGTVALLFVSMPLTVGTPVNKLTQMAKLMTGYHPPIGNWGWAGVWVTNHPTRLSTTAGSVVDQRRFDRHETRCRRRAARGVVVAARSPARYRDRHYDSAGGDHASVRHPVPALAGAVAYRLPDTAVDAAAHRARRLRRGVLSADVHADVA